MQPNTPAGCENLPEAIARTLRHEVGDLLQTVYATVAILQERLAKDLTVERRFLTDLRSRAETCKQELDAVHDLIVPIQLHTANLDLKELVTALATLANKRFAALEINVDCRAPAVVHADPQRCDQIIRLLITQSCLAARKRLTIVIMSDDDFVSVNFTDDGYGPTPEQSEWLQRPFATTQQALSGLSLALARRVAELHGGQVQLDVVPEGGSRVTLRLPRNAASEK